MEDRKIFVVALALVILIGFTVSFGLLKSNSKLSADKIELETELEQKNRSIADLQSKIDSLEAEKRSLKSTTEGLKDDKKSLQSNLSALQQRAVAGSAFQWDIENRIITVEYSLRNFGRTEVSDARAVCGLREQGGSDFYDIFQINDLSVASQSTSTRSYTYDVSDIQRTVSDDVLVCVLQEVQGLNLDRRLYGNEDTYKPLFEVSEDHETESRF